jgi:hypothetical protein
MHYQTQTTKYNTIYVGDPYVQELFKCITFTCTIEDHNYIRKPITQTNLCTTHWTKIVRYVIEMGQTQNNSNKLNATQSAMSLNNQGCGPWSFELHHLVGLP